MAVRTDLLFLLGDLVHLGVAGVLFAFLPRERVSMFLSGILLFPFGVVLPPIAEEVYWTPGRVFGGVIGIEDILFGFAFGALAWAIAALLAGPLRALRLASWKFVRRALIAGIVGTVLFFFTWSADLPMGLGLLVPQIGVAALVLIIRPGFLRLAILTAVGLTLYYMLTLAMMVAVFGDEFTEFWSTERFLGPLYFGVPIEEVLWATSFGAAWVPMLLWASEPESQSA